MAERHKNIISEDTYITSPPRSSHPPKKSASFNFMNLFTIKDSDYIQSKSKDKKSGCEKCKCDVVISVMQNPLYFVRVDLHVRYLNMVFGVARREFFYLDGIPFPLFGGLSNFQGVMWTYICFILLDFYYRSITPNDTGLAVSLGFYSAI